MISPGTREMSGVALLQRGSACYDIIRGQNIDDVMCGRPHTHVRQYIAGRRDAN